MTRWRFQSPAAPLSLASELISEDLERPKTSLKHRKCLLRPSFASRNHRLLLDSDDGLLLSPRSNSMAHMVARKQLKDIAGFACWHCWTKRTDGKHSKHRCPTCQALFGSQSGSKNAYAPCAPRNLTFDVLASNHGPLHGWNSGSFHILCYEPLMAKSGSSPPNTSSLARSFEVSLPVSRTMDRTTRNHWILSPTGQVFLAC